MSQTDLAGVTGENDDADNRQPIDEQQRADPVIITRWEKRRRQRNQCQQNQQRRPFGGKTQRRTRRSIDLAP